MTYRIVGIDRRTGRERIAASGLPREAALATVERMRKDPLIRGFCLSIEPDGPKEDLGPRIPGTTT